MNTLQKHGIDTLSEALAEAKAKMSSTDMSDIFKGLNEKDALIKLDEFLKKADTKFSPKQKEVWKNTVKQHHRWNVSYGATRSGKTYMDYFRIPTRIRRAGKTGHILLLGNTEGTLERNILDPLRNMYGDVLVGNIGSKNKVRLFGRTCYALGADKKNQVARIQGMGLEYCYGDEITTWAEDVFTMLKSRLDKPNSCFDGTCNPEAPTHWFKKFLDSGADIYQMLFTIDDNPYLTKDFVANLKKEYTGTIFYDRFILGKWIAAQGIIYRLFADKPDTFIIDKPPQIMFATIGVDFGGNGSAHAFNCTGFTPRYDQVITLEDYCRKEIISSDMLEEDFINFVLRCKRNYKVTDVYCDSAEQVLIQGLKNAAAKRGLGINIHNAAKGEITQRIRFYSAIMAQGRYKIMRGCTNTIDALRRAQWDSRSVTVDKRLDDGTTNIDNLDAQEYSTESVQKQILDMVLLRR